MAFSFLDLFREAEGDENQNAAPADNAGNADANANQGNANNDNAGGNEPDGPDNDFNMDMSLDDSTGGGDEGGDDASLDTDTGTDDAGATATGGDNEPIDANTDIFYSLTAEEQQMKITMLKKQYLDLFNACDDLVEKINDIENDERTILYLAKIGSTLMALKDYITDYLYNKFDSVSFYENDVKFNEFEAIFAVIRNILQDVYKINIQNE